MAIDWALRNVLVNSACQSVRAIPNLFNFYIYVKNLSNFYVFVKRNRDTQRFGFLIGLYEACQTSGTLTSHEVYSALITTLIGGITHE